MTRLRLVLILAAAITAAVAVLAVVVITRPEIDFLGLNTKIEEIRGRWIYEKAKPFEPRLQAAATKACQCARSPGADADKCWSGYRSLTKGLSPTTMTSACIPSTTVDCFGSYPNEFCILIDVNGNLCTDEEAALVEGARQAAAKRHGEEAGNRAAAAMTDAIIRGEPAKGPKGSGSDC